MRIVLMVAAAAIAMPALAQGTGQATTQPMGLSPTTPAMASPPTPGAPVQVVASQDPNVAFPPPPPPTSTPICKKGQTDGCMERGSKK